MDMMTILIAGVLFLILAAVLIGLYFALRGGQNSPAQQKPGAGPADVTEVARLERDKTTGMLMLVLDGKLYAKASDLTFAQRQKLIAAANDLQKWLGLPSAVTPSVADSATKPPLASTPSVSASGTTAPADLKPISTNPLDSLRRSMGPSKPAASFKSIPAQIEEILQGMLVDTPLEKRGIHLSELPGSGVVVQVGLDQYPGIEAVPDEEVRSVLRAAVAEWERQNRLKPGE
jgi:hypothetical protein